MYSTTGTLTPAAPFDFAKSLDFLGHFRPAMGEQHIDQTTLTKAASFNGQGVVFQVRSGGTLDAPQLSYTLFSDAAISDALDTAVRERITSYLSLDDDLRPFYELGQADPNFAPLVERMYGYHQVKFPTPFENACWAILSQRNPMSVAHKMKERLAEQYGAALTLNGKIYRAFPEPFPLAIPPVDDLNAVIHNSRKAESISDVARAFSSVDESWLRTGAFEEVRAWLLNLKGIGAWSASFILIRGLGRLEEIPLEEKWMLEAARKVYGRDTLTYDDLHRLAAPYGQYQGYWGHYLRASAS